MPDYTNRFKQSLKAGKANIGLWISIPDAFTTEICATAEFDWMLLDGEHTPTDPLTIMSQLQACAAYNTQAVARPPIGETHLIKQLLDLGVQSLLIPMVDTAEQAARVARWHDRGLPFAGESDSADGRADSPAGQADYSIPWRFCPERQATPAGGPGRSAGSSSAGQAAGGRPRLPGGADRCRAGSSRGRAGPADVWPAVLVGCDENNVENRYLAMRVRG